MGCLLRQRVPAPVLRCAICGGAPRWAIPEVSTRGGAAPLRVRAASVGGPASLAHSLALCGLGKSHLTARCLGAPAGPELRAWLQGRRSRGWPFPCHFPGRETEALSVCLQDA